MSPKTKHTHKNRLWQARQRTHLGQKQVAMLIHQQTANQISRYEIGSRMPSLETALRLSIIYRVPVRSLFFGLYEALQDELKNTLPEDGKNLKVCDLDEYCAFEEFLEDPDITAEDYKKAKKHTIVMVNKTAEVHTRGKYLSL